MSLYIQWLNLIKERSTSEWLTHNQREVYERLLKDFHSHAFVNIFGPSGSGKTFLARILAKEEGYLYVQDLEEVGEEGLQVVLDNASYDRMLRVTRRIGNMGRVTLLTRQPVREAMPRLELTLDDRDVRQFMQNLHDHCDIVFLKTMPEDHDLGKLLRDELVARGKSNVSQRP